MDAFKLLTRSTKLKARDATRKNAPHLPSEGPAPGLIEKAELQQGESEAKSIAGSKRKRDSAGRWNFSNSGTDFGHVTDRNSNVGKSASSATGEDSGELACDGSLTKDERRRILNEHKIKIVNLTELREAAAREKSKAESSESLNRADSLGKSQRKARKDAFGVFPHPLTSFHQLRTIYEVNHALVDNILDQGYFVPTEVQLATIPLLLPTSEKDDTPHLLTVAPTGSGKTLAFMIPLIEKLHLERRQKQMDQSDTYRCVKAVIVAPTKELVGQIVNEGRKLVQRTGVKITAMRKGMRFAADGLRVDLDQQDNEEDKNRETLEDHNPSTVVKSDILVTTPLLFVKAITESSSKQSLSLIGTLILDEADILLDPLFREQTLILWKACQNLALHTSFWSATIGSNIEELVASILQTRNSSLSITRSAPLLRCVVGLKDSPLPTITHKLVYAGTEPGKLLGLRQLLHPPPAVDGRRTMPPLRPPFLVFTQTIERAIALHAELLYDIPSEAGGSSRIAVLHADLSDTKRADVMARFRKGLIWVLITTDLLSRGVDFRGVNGVVNYDIPNTSAAYVHRVGRTGRAGREGGVAVTFYTQEDIKYVKSIANIISASEKIKAKSGVGEGEGGIQKWLLNALPDLTKRDKQRLKMRGVEARRAIREGEDEKSIMAKRKNRISTKSGYERRLESRRKGFVQGSRQIRYVRDDGEEVDETDGDEWSGIED